MGEKLNNSSKKLKVSANPLGLLAENRSNKKACPNKRPLLIIIWGDIIVKYILLTLTYFKAKSLLLVNRILSNVVLVV